MQLQDEDENNPLPNSEEDGQASATNRIGLCQFVIVSAAGKRTMLPSKRQEKKRGEGEAMIALARAQRVGLKAFTSEHGMQGASLHELRPGTVQKHTERLSTRSTRNSQKCLDVLDEHFLESVPSLGFDDSSPL
jgi:hypothetical protein